MWPLIERSGVTRIGLTTVSTEDVPCREAVPPCVHKAPPLGTILRVHRTSCLAYSHRRISLVMVFQATSGSWSLC